VNLAMYDAEWQALSLHIGSGREAPDGKMTLSMEYRAASDLCWRNAHVTGGEQTLWCDSAAFSEWLAADYPAGNFADYERGLWPLLTTLGLAPADDFFCQARFTPGELMSAQLAPGWYPVLTLHRENIHFPLVLQGWSTVLLRQLTCHWLPWHSSGEPLTVPFALNVGHSLLTLEQLLALQAGDGIVLHSTAAISDNHLWLYLQEKRIVMSVNENEIQVISVEEELPPPSCYGEITSIEKLPLKVVAEVAIARLALDELINIAPGMIFPTRATVQGNVRLTLNGACIGHGCLIALNDGLVVRVDSLVSTAISRPQPAPVSEEQTHGEEGEDHGMAG